MLYSKSMPRGLREFEVGGIYHIIQRGVEKRKIFLKDQDYSRFIFGLEFFNQVNPINLWDFLAKVGTVPTLAIQVERARKGSSLVELLAFALMPNHYLLLVREIQRGGISLFMRKMGGYSTYFNKQYERVGPLFQSRYKAVPIKTTEQLQTVFVYVHTNPVELRESEWKNLYVRDRENAIQWLRSYRWSSYHDYTGTENFPFATQRNFFLDFFAGAEGCREAVESWITFKSENTLLDVSLME